MIIVINISNKEIRFTSYLTDNLTSKYEEKIFLSRKFEKYQVALRLFKETIKLLITNHTLVSILISYPGEISTQTGLLIDSYSFQAWNGSNLNKDLAKYFHCNILTINDAVLSGFAQIFNDEEIRKKKQLNILFGNDSGIGGSIIYRNDGEIMVYPIEIGHFIVVPDGELCLCGQRGCLEAYSSIKALNILYGDVLTDGIENESVILASRYLAQVIISIVAIINIDSIVFGGDLALHSRIFLDHLASTTNWIIKKKNSWLSIPEIYVSELNSSAIEIGALKYYSCSLDKKKINYFSQI